MDDQSGNAGMYVSGKTIRFAELEAARSIREMAFRVVRVAERKCGEAWQAATRMGPGMVWFFSGRGCVLMGLYWSLSKLWVLCMFGGAICCGVP